MRTHQLTVNPGITDNNCPFWKLQLGYFGFHTLIFQRKLLYLCYFISICVAVNVGTEADVALDIAMRQVQYSFVKFIL